MAQSAIQSWCRPGSAVSLSLGGEQVSMERAEVDRLVRSLRQSPLPGAHSISEEISAQTVSGHVALRPTEAELEALMATLERLRPVADEHGALGRLLVVGRALRDQGGTAGTGAIRIRAAVDSAAREDET